MAGYDPQKARGRHEIPDDEPAPVDGLLGPAPEVDGAGPTLAHDAGRPMVRQVLPVPPHPPADPTTEIDEADAPVDVPVDAESVEVESVEAASVEVASVEVAPTTDEPGSQPELVTDAEPTAGTSANAALASRARVAAIVVALVALVVFVLWRRRRR